MAANAKKQVATTKKALQAADAQYAENERIMTAYKMKKEGRSWWQIAEALKISEYQASRLVSQAITVASSLVDNAYKRELLSMELDRLDDLQRAVWQDAINGDLKAVETALKIIQTRAKVLGLDNVQSATVTNNTIVVAGTSEEYINALRQAAQKPLMIESEQDATT